jgi:hypothetical protein
VQRKVDTRYSVTEREELCLIQLYYEDNEYKERKSLEARRERNNQIPPAGANPK